MNGQTLTAIAATLDVNIRDVYAKIDYLNEVCLEFAARREEKLPACLAGKVLHLATDTQILLINWSDNGIRKQVEVRHTCTVERTTGYVVAATTDVDPDIGAHVEQALAEIRGEVTLSRAMRQNARIWFADDYINYIRGRYESLRHKKSNPTNAPQDMSSDARLLLRCGRVFQDVAEYAHILLVKSKIGNQFQHLNYTTDRDAGLSQAVCAIFSDEIRAGRVSVADVTFTKNSKQGLRRSLVAQGQSFLQTTEARMALSGFSPKPHNGMDSGYTRTNPAMQFLLQEAKDRYGSDALKKWSADGGIDYPFHFINEPEKRVFIRTDTSRRSVADIASFIINAGTHAVDSYHARGRYKVMGFERGLSPSGSGGLYYYKQYYDPVRVLQITNILRFAHNYMALMRKSVCPAKSIGLSAGFIADRDLG